MRWPLIVPTFGILLLAGCGAGGGGGGSGGGPETPPVGGGGGGSGVVALGEARALPIGMVKVSEELTGVPAGKLQYLIQITPDAGQPAITKVEGGIGGDDPPAGYGTAAAVDGQANTWRLTLDKPSTWPANPRAYGRVTDAEGNVHESGPTDFGTSAH